DNGRFAVYAVPRGDTTLKVLEAAIDDVIDALIAEGISEAELERAKTRLIAGAVYAQDSQSRLARAFGAALTTGATVEEVQNWPDEVAKVTAEEIIAAAQKNLVEERSVTGFLIREPAGPEAQAADRS
ncbi:MAG TPA: insulinase family protein, partial [Hyphomicrobiales bacterium]|nr:insulinase family protein [Hyphomicrobiales bacterium]